MGRRRMPRTPEVKVAVRTEVRQLTQLEATALALVAALAAGLAGLWWMGAAGLAR